MRKLSAMLRREVSRRSCNDIIRRHITMPYVINQEFCSACH